MTLTQKVAALRSAGFPIRYADRFEPSEMYLDNPKLTTYQDYVDWAQVHEYPRDNTRVYADLSRIGKGEDYYDQSTTLDRSNYRRFREDYPDTFTDTSYSNVNSLGAYIGNLSNELIETLTGLAEQYPVYDEEDMSAIEDSEITGQWEDFAANELGRELPEDTRETWDTLSADAKRDMFWQACETAGYYPEHNGIEVLWSYAYERTVPLIAERLGHQS